MVEMTRIKAAAASLEIDGSMTKRQVADSLAAMVFTCAKGWTRTVRMDRDIRDLIVEALRK